MRSWHQGPHLVVKFDPPYARAQGLGVWCGGQRLGKRDSRVGGDILEVRGLVAGVRALCRGTCGVYIYVWRGVWVCELKFNFNML
jgi:hypothetical protein